MFEKKILMKTLKMLLKRGYILFTSWRKTVLRQGEIQVLNNDIGKVEI